MDSMTRLVLVNAIYFKGKWVEPFEESDTENAKFRITKVTPHKNSSGWRNTGFLK